MQLHAILSFGMFVCTINAALQADSPINPLPRAVKSTVLHTWDFDGGVDGWQAENQCSLSAENGVLRAVHR